MRPDEDKRAKLKFLRQKFERTQFDKGMIQRHILLRKFVDTDDYGIELLKAHVDPEDPPCW